VTRALVLFALLALSACSAPPPVAAMGDPPPPVAPETVRASQPAVVPTYNNVSPPRGAVGVTLWGPVERLPSPPTDATSAGGVLAIVIDSASIPGNVAAKNGLGTIAMGWSPVAWIQATWFKQAYRLRVPRADAYSGGVAQVVTYFNFRDRVNSASLWMGQVIYDTRCDKGGDIGWDQGTNTPMFNVVAAGFSCTPYGAWRDVSFNVGPEQLKAAASALRARFPTLRLSSNPADYSLTHANINPETATKLGGPARIDVGVSGWKLSTQP